MLCLKKVSPFFREEEDLPEPMPKKKKVATTRGAIAEKRKTTEASVPLSPNPVAQRESRSKKKHDVASASQEHVSCR